MTAYIKKGFTLIELLIVIAILGVLAVVILVAINPQEQLERTRDAGRTSAVTQFGHAMQAYATSHDGVYMDATLVTNCAGGGTSDWLDCMVDAGEIAQVPDDLTQTGQTACGINAVSGYCYVDDGTLGDGLVFARLQSGTNIDRCSASGNEPYIGFDSSAGRGGIFCHDSALEAGIAPGTVTFIN